jgi:glucose-6-phosphate 1-epimerase
MSWDLLHAGVEPDGRARAVLRVVDTDATRRLWPHRFALEVSVTVSGRMLDIALAVRNAGDEAFEFTAALHSYLAVRDAARTVVHGLAGARYRDKVLGRDDCVERTDELRIDGEVDRVYYCSPQRLEVREPERAMAIRATGFADTVVWNPGAKRAAALTDLELGGEARMLCVEAAAAANPVVLAPGAQWNGAQTLTAR